MRLIILPVAVRHLAPGVESGGVILPAPFAARWDCGTLRPVKIVFGNDPDAKKIQEKLDVIIELLTRLTFQLTEIHEQGEQQMADLSALQTEVSENGEVAASAVALLNGLSQQLKDALAANDPAAIQALVDQLDANTQGLADAVAANTDNVPHPDQTLPGDSDSGASRG